MPAISAEEGEGEWYHLRNCTVQGGGFQKLLVLNIRGSHKTGILDIPIKTGQTGEGERNYEFVSFLY